MSSDSKIMKVKYRLTILIITVFGLITVMLYEVINRKKVCSFDLFHLESMQDIEKLLIKNPCGQNKKLLDIYHIEVEGAPIRIPDTFRETVSGWLDGNKILLEQAENQKVIQITNR